MVVAALMMTSPRGGGGGRGPDHPALLDLETVHLLEEGALEGKNSGSSRISSPRTGEGALARGSKGRDAGRRTRAPVQETRRADGEHARRLGRRRARMTNARAGWREETLG